MFDMDKFIECVHAKPGLWDQNCKEYSRKICREKLWLEIGEIMFENWEEYDLAVRDEKVKNMRNKFRHIRDNFLRSIHQGKSGASAHKKRKYVYADALHFLLNSMKKRQTSGNIAENAQEEEIGEDHDEEEELPAKNCEPRRKNQPRETELRKHANLTLFQTELLKKIEETPKAEEEDADKSYLLSLLPEFKKLNDDEKLDFRMTNLQFFRNLRRNKSVPNLPPNHSSQFSTSHQFQQYRSPLSVQSTSLSTSSYHSIWSI